MYSLERRSMPAKLFRRRHLLQTEGLSCCVCKGPVPTALMRSLQLRTGAGAARSCGKGWDSSVRDKKMRRTLAYDDTGPRKASWGGMVM